MDDIFAKLAALRPAKNVPTGAVQWLIVGLGNPDKKYEGTRHNIGFAAIDRMAEKLGTQANRLKFKALCGDCTLGGKRALLMKPTTYMNLSGQAVQEAMRYHKLPVERVIVLCDDVNLEVGRLRIRAKGSAGGHNGLKSIMELAGGDAFFRVRIGVGEKPHPDYDLADWVLGKFDEQDKKQLQPLLDDLLPACELLVEEKLQDAMSRFNR